MSPVTLTIGMPAVDNYSQVRSTLQDIRRHNPEVMDRVSFVVVDNAPASKSSKRIRRLCEGWADKSGNLGCKYVPMDNPKGTAPAKQRCIDESTGDCIVVMDSHVFLPHGWVAKLLDFYDRTGRTNDLYTGPLLYDDLGYKTRGPTHFDPHWRSEMWGIWGVAWGCPCRDPLKSDGPGLIFSHNGVYNEGETVTFYALSREALVPVTKCGACGRTIPKPARPGGGYERTLLDAGYHPLGQDTGHAPFEIPAMGMGFFTCWRSAWPGFNPHFVGFGGEELYIHHKLAQRGDKVWCLPFLPWDHEFNEVGSPLPYDASHWHKMRNYVIGFQELGLDLQPIHDHFVDGHKTTVEQWEFLLKDPIKHSDFRAAGADKGPTNSQPPLNASDTIALYTWTKAQPRDFAVHMDVCRKYARGHVVANFSRTRESTIAFAAGDPKYIKTFTSCEEPILKRCQAALGYDKMEFNPLVPVAVECDVLLIDGEATASWSQRIWEANESAVKFAYLIHNARLHGELGEDGQPGLMGPLAWFLRRNPEWAVVEIHGQKNGLVVIARPDVVGLRAMPAPFWRPSGGPGTRMMETLKSVGVTDKPGCDCKAKAGLMDVWGVKGCRIHYDTILSWLVEGQERWTWAEKLKIAAAAVGTGLAFSLNPINPVKSLLDKALEE